MKMTVQEKIRAAIGEPRVDASELNDVRTLAQSALSTVLPENLVFAEGYIGDTMQDWPDEHIRFYVDRELEEEYADNLATLLHTELIVIWFGKDINKKKVRPGEIARAMRNAGFAVMNRQTDILREAGSLYYGFAAEYVMESTVRENTHE